MRQTFNFCQQSDQHHRPDVTRQRTSCTRRGCHAINFTQTKLRKTRAVFSVLFIDSARALRTLAPTRNGVKPSATICRAVEVAHSSCNGCVHQTHLETMSVYSLQQRSCKPSLWYGRSEEHHARTCTPRRATHTVPDRYTFSSCSVTKITEHSRDTSPSESTTRMSRIGTSVYLTPSRASPSHR